MDLTSTIVALRRCHGYQPELLDHSVDSMISCLDKPENLRSARILLKPNLITAKKGSLACTNGRFLQAVARWFLDQGARVSVGDSPAFGNTHSVLKELSLLEPFRRMGVEVRNFDQVRTVTLPSGIRAGMAVEALECDLLVNLPRIKAHGQLFLTMAIKNCFGCLVGMRKPVWHMLHGGAHGKFCDLLIEILDVLPRSLSLVDGITAMHETGPINGSPYDLGLLAGGVNPIAVDRALLEVLNVDPVKSPLMATCIGNGYTGTVLETLQFPLENPAALKVTDFRLPGELIDIRFNIFRFIRNSIKRFFLNTKNGQ